MFFNSCVSHSNDQCNEHVDDIASVIQIIKLTKIDHYLKY